MKQRELEVLTQRVRTSLEGFPETRESDSLLVFRVSILYGAEYSENTASDFPFVEQILQARDNILSGGD